MKYFVAAVMILFTSKSVYTQSNWQQQVNYKIDVLLNDETNELHGFESFVYKNNSPDTLHYIYMHLWPNAYKQTNTAFDQQKIKSGDVAFHYADDNERGYIDSLHFESNNQELKIDSTAFLPLNDIISLLLNQPLLPNDSIIVQTPFHVKIPANFSRLSHVGQSYQISQWYPKPAVYDQKGWHAMHYLDQGEFYSEFGTFQVSITLPENYIVGASGILQEQSEIDFLKALSKDSIKSEEIKDHLQFPTSSKKMKTITFRQDHIHDFAWFADKRYYVRMSEVELPISGRKVTTYAMFTAEKIHLWRHAVEYIDRALLFYSEKIGEYPYNFCTAIDGTISAGGGMEYPMITCIGTCYSPSELDIVIAHEVGHNWFYGILASNERDHPWMDEGINSYYENAYTEKYYPELKLYESIAGSKTIGKLLGAVHINTSYENKLFYLYSAASNHDQPNDMASAGYTKTNYASIVYSKSVLILHQLKSFMGEPAFDLAMHDYYHTCMFKHVYPEDFKNIFSKYAKQDISWFFSDFLESNKKQKIKISAVKNTGPNMAKLIIVNKGKTKTPIPLETIFQDKTTTTQWYQMNQKKIAIDVDLQKVVSTSVLQGDKNINLYSTSNTAVVKHAKLYLTHPLAVKMIGLLKEPQKKQLNILPAIGWNHADKTMLGLMFYSSLIPAPKFEYAIAPMIGLGSLRPTGLFKLAYHVYPKWSERLTFQLNGQSFSYHDYYNVAKHKTLPLDYYRLAYSTEIRFKNRSPLSTIQKSISGRAIMVYQSFENDFNKGIKAFHFYNTNELKFNWKNTRKINPYNFVVALQQCKDFMTTSATANFYISFAKTKGYVRIRFFAGAFLYHHNPVIDPNKGLLPPNRDLTMSSNGAAGNVLARTNEDFTYDAIYLDRSGQDPVFSHQVFTNKEGGFHSLIGSGLGNSAKWILSLAVSAKIPKHVPIKPFATIGTGYLFNSKTGVESYANFLAEAGFSIVALADIFEIHFPLLVTDNIKANQEFNFGIDKFYERITFTLDLNLLNPFERIKRLKY